jgi:hypothetical protein
MSKWAIRAHFRHLCPRAFQWYKKHHKTLSFDPSNCSLKFRKSTRTRSPKMGVALGVWGFTPSHFLTLPGVCDVTPGLPLGSHPCNPFVLVASPKLGLRHLWRLVHHQHSYQGYNSCNPTYMTIMAHAFLYPNPNSNNLGLGFDIGFLQVLPFRFSLSSMVQLHPYCFTTWCTNGILFSTK